jgi:hypothetical protein
LKHLLSVILLLVVCIAARAADELPFAKYSARVYRGHVSRPDLETGNTKQHTTAIRKGVKQGPNFAGHYVLVSWGCGTSCAAYVIVDAISGGIYEPPELSKGVELSMGGPEYRLDSRLLILADCPEPRVYGYKDCDKKFYKWDADHFVLLKVIPITGDNVPPPEEKPPRRE